MTRLLPTVLSTRDLPLAELCASRLDGEIYPIDECFATIGQPDTPAARGAAVLVLTGPTVVASGASALWIRGYLEAPPPVHTVCIDREARARPPATGRVEVHEAKLVAHDIQLFGGMRTFTAERVLFDLVLHDRFDRRSRLLAELVLERRGADPGLLRRRINESRNLPGKRRAVRRMMSLQKGRVAIV